MPAIDRTKIPDSALTDICNLISWACSAAEVMYQAEVLVRETPNVSAPAVVVGIFKDLDRVPRFSARVNLPLDNNYNLANLPVWGSIQPVANIAVPAQFLKA